MRNRSRCTWHVHDRRNVATNAGGNQVLRYGMTRRNALGLEVARGRARNSIAQQDAEEQRGLRLDAALHWKPALSVSSPASCWDCTRARRVGRHSVQSITSRTHSTCCVRSTAATPAGFSCSKPWREYMDAAIDRSGLTQPFAERHEITLLLEATMERGPESADAFAETLAGFIEAGLVKDAFIAQFGNDAGVSGPIVRPITSSDASFRRIPFRREHSPVAHGGGRRSRCGSAAAPVGRNPCSSCSAMWRTVTSTSRYVTRATTKPWTR